MTTTKRKGQKLKNRMMMQVTIAKGDLIIVLYMSGGIDAPLPLYSDVNDDDAQFGTQTEERYCYM